MSSTPNGRRRRPQEFMLPGGKKVIASLPEDLDGLRQKYENHDGSQVEIVVHGSAEHANYLEQSRSHHEGRREELRERHGPAFDEWEDVHHQLKSVNSELERFSNQKSGLSANFGKFGYDAGLRTYNDHGSGTATARTSISDSTSDDEKYFDESRVGETIKLFKKPVVRQWFHRGLLWRASEETEVMAIELFFDLLYVGIIHINGEHMSADPTAEELLRFAITFMMTWKIWTEITSSLSWFESDDVLTRLEILFDLACLLGFTTNMINSFNHDPEHNTYTPLVVFYLATRFKAALHFAATAYLLPMIRGVMVTSIINVLIPAAIWIASIHVGRSARLGLVWTALFIDTYGQVFSLGLFQYGRLVGKETLLGRFVERFFEFYPAANIEHRVERTNAFVSLVFGYSVVGILFQSHGGYTLNAFLGKAVLGLVQAFLFNWIYFDVDGHNIKVHAIRRSWYSSAMWAFAHLPFVMGYIVASSGLTRLVLATDVPNTSIEQLEEEYHAHAEDHIPKTVRFFYCYGLAIALLSMGAISLSHHHRKPATLRWGKSYRLSNRIAVCIVLFFLPLVDSLRSLDLISITLALTVWVLLVELWGKSCSDDPFIGQKGGCCVRYLARCSKRDLERAGTEQLLRRRSVDVVRTGTNEKTAA